MDFDAKITDVHQRSAQTLLRLQELEAQAQQLAGMRTQYQAELLKLDGETRALVALKAEADRGQ